MSAVDVPDSESAAPETRVGALADNRDAIVDRHRTSESFSGPAACREDLRDQGRIVAEGELADGAGWFDVVDFVFEFRVVFEDFLLICQNIILRHVISVERLRV